MMSICLYDNKWSIVHSRSFTHIIDSYLHLHIECAKISAITGIIKRNLDSSLWRTLSTSQKVITSINCPALKAFLIQKKTLAMCTNGYRLRVPYIAEFQVRFIHVPIYNLFHFFSVNIIPNLCWSQPIWSKWRRGR